MSCPVRDPLDAKNDFLPENKRARHRILLQKWGYNVKSASPSRSIPAEN